MSKENAPRRWKLTTAILSLSLLTVMAGAAVAPALSLIQDYFKNVDSMFVQLIISMPALFIGFANGVGIPFIISSASIKAGKNAASTVMPLLSISMYLSQFLAPFILSGLEKLMGTFIPGFHSFQAAMITAALLFFLSFTIKGSAQLPQKPQIHQEKHQKH
jgi:hypothetical protein